MDNPLQQILERKIKLYVYATGAGAGLQKRLWDVPGCSSFLVGCGFPYDTKKTEKILGHKPESFVSKETSIELAMAAYMEAYNPDDNVDDVIGIGLTASVASLKAHRGEHRVIVTALSNKKCITKSVVIQKGDASYRLADGEIADELGELALLEVLGLPAVASSNINSNLLESHTEEISNEELTNIIMSRPYLKVDGTRGIYERPLLDLTSHKLDGTIEKSKIPSHRVIYNPGTFNPLHYGHIEAASAARERRINDICFDVDLIYTTCINPLHKPMAMATDLLQKISQMKGKNFLLTKDDGLFLDKARTNPRAGFVLGADALLNMLNPKWYADPTDIEKMLEEFIELNVKFYIIGRVIDGKFITLDDIKDIYPIVKGYWSQFCSVSGRWDISSTELRNANK